jgi:hypothetical protein
MWRSSKCPPVQRLLPGLLLVSCMRPPSSSTIERTSVVAAATSTIPQAPVPAPATPPPAPPPLAPSVVVDCEPNAWNLPVAPDAGDPSQQAQTSISWKDVDANRWRAARENYQRAVAPNLNGVGGLNFPYLGRVHARIHPYFSIAYLGYLDSLQPSDLRNDQDIATQLELVLSPEDGRIVRMGVIRSSGVLDFDAGALEAVQSASPFGCAPPALTSADGNVYLHWELFRNPIPACSTYFARIYVLP